MNGSCSTTRTFIEFPFGRSGVSGSLFGSSLLSVLTILEVVQQVVMESLGWHQWNPIRFQDLAGDDKMVDGGSCEILFV